MLRTLPASKVFNILHRFTVLKKKENVSERFYFPLDTCKNHWIDVLEHNEFTMKEGHSLSTPEHL